MKGIFKLKGFVCGTEKVQRLNYSFLLKFARSFQTEQNLPIIPEILCGDLYCGEQRSVRYINVIRSRYGSRFGRILFI